MKLNNMLILRVRQHLEDGKNNEIVKTSPTLYLKIYAGSKGETTLEKDRILLSAARRKRLQTLSFQWIFLAYARLSQELQ